jgi:hypothetical protein
VPKILQMLVLKLEKNYGMIDDGSKGGAQLLKQIKNPSKGCS